MTRFKLFALLTGCDLHMNNSADIAQLGFVLEPSAIHSRRSISVNDVRLLFASTKPTLSYEEIRQLVIDNNILGKGTYSSRQGILRCLREFYGLNSDILVYSALRFFWHYDIEEQPLLALLCAAARDPILRQSAGIVLAWPQDTTLPKAALEETLKEKYSNRYSPGIMAGMVRRLLSSWKQAGHLSGHRTKVRTRATSGPASTAYALFLGYITGLRGQYLLDSLWVKLLDAPLTDVHDYAFAAANRGWLDYKNAGGVVEISFPDVWDSRSEK